MVKEERKKIAELEKQQYKTYLDEERIKLEYEQTRRKELETQRRTLRALEFQQTLEEKERVKQLEKVKDFEWDRVQVERAIREAEEIRRKEEDKRVRLRMAQGTFVEQSRIEREKKEREKKREEQQEFQKSVVHNTYF